MINNLIKYVNGLAVTNLVSLWDTDLNQRSKEIIDRERFGQSPRSV